MRGRKLGLRARRVVIKSRFVVLARAGKKSVPTHLRYIERDGTTREGGRGQAYGPETDAADLKAFEARGRGDRHQFRMILSVEDAPQLEDLQQYTRELMKQVEADLETPLDWVAVDHWDTDNPHTHIVLRGRSADGSDLVIAPDYMAHGMRMRASDIATQWLGPRTELEIQESLRKEVGQERFTSLDRALLGSAAEGIVDLREQHHVRRNSSQLVGRLQRLQGMGLAEKLGAERWRLAPNIRDVLRVMGGRGDIVRAVNQAFQGSSRDIAFERGDAGAITGRLAGKGIADELSDRTYVVLDGVDGRAHYVEMPARTDLSEFPRDSILQISHRKGGLVHARVLCHLSVEDQVRAIGPTWLDRQLVNGADVADRGFGALVHDALRMRTEFLVRQGLAEWRDGKLIAQGLVESLRTREFNVTVRDVSERTGLPHLADASRLRGVRCSVRQLTLASGRFALLESEVGFSLLPWGKHVSPSRAGPSR